MNFISKIEKPDSKQKVKTKKYLDSLVKPIGSLGRLEDFAVKLSGITGKMHNDLFKKAIVVFGADNGVWDEGVTPVPQSVTDIQMRNMVRGVAGVSVLARQSNIDLKVVNIGVKQNSNFNGIIDANLMLGTNNIAKEPAMTIATAKKAIDYGFKMAGKLKENGYKLLGVGEMGICNTTTSAAMLCAFTGKSVDEIAGMGAGIDNEHYHKKVATIKKALKINNPNPSDPLDVVSKVGGLDIAGMAGMFLGGAYYKIPTVIDGYISMVAALLAFKFNPLVKEYIFASHKSAERGYTAARIDIGLMPMFDLEMRLGEGSGCPFAFYALEASQRIIKDMVTFKEGNVNDNDYVDIRKPENN
jgi:nicotinate-nucleotide--dimethylbenzimidazole phosphoribosyltransferase